MRHLRLLIVCYLTSMKLLSQEIVIEKQNDLVANIRNSVKILIENCDCNKIQVHSSNSRVKKDKNCRFVVIPKNDEKTLLKIYKKENNDSILIGTRKFRVKNDFDYKTGLKNRKQIFTDSISISLIKNFNYQISAYPSKQICFEYYNRNIKEFSLIVMKKDGSLFLNKNIGYNYDLRSKKLLNELEIGDKIFFTEIFMESPLTKENIKLNSLNIKIVK